MSSDSVAQRVIFPVLSRFREERFLIEFILSFVEGVEMTCEFHIATQAPKQESR